MINSLEVKGLKQSFSIRNHLALSFFAETSDGQVTFNMFYILSVLHMEIKVVSLRSRLFYFVQSVICTSRL